MSQSLAEFVAPVPAAGHAGPDAKACLDALRVLRVGGEEARSFLHAQFTADLKRLDSQHGGLAAWCTPKGRVLYLMHVLNIGDAWLLLVPASEAAALLKRLRMYVLRAKVTLEDLGADWSVMGQAVATAHALPGNLTRSGECWTLALTSTLQVVLGPHAGVIAQWTANAAPAVDQVAWERLEIDAALPRITGALVERFLPQELDLERLQGLHFDKGCYPGQEVIARLKYRGQVKSGLRRGVCAGTVEPGDKLYRADTAAAVGDVLRVAPDGDHTQVLAVLSFEAAADELHARDAQGPTLRFDA